MWLTWLSKHFGLFYFIAYDPETVDCIWSQGQNLARFMQYLNSQDRKELIVRINKYSIKEWNIRDYIDSSDSSGGKNCQH